MINKKEGNWISVGSFLKFAEDTTDLVWDKYTPLALFDSWSRGDMWDGEEPANYKGTADVEKTFRYLQWWKSILHVSRSNFNSPEELEIWKNLSLKRPTLAGKRNWQDSQTSLTQSFIK